MISRETRASGLLRQLSRARPMTAADLVVVSKAHAARQSQHTCEKFRLSTPTLYKWSRIPFNNNDGKITRRHDEICWMKGHFNRIIAVCNRVPISKHDLCSSVFLLADFTEVCRSIAQSNPSVVNIARRVDLQSRHSYPYSLLIISGRISLKQRNEQVD